MARFEAAHDDYSSIMLKALADRLAEALAERMHERVRRELWGYAPQEQLDGDALIREEYRGIRPAPGYPACPDHTEKATLWQLLDAGAHRRHPADRILCDVSDRGGQRILFLASAGALLRRRARSTAIRWRSYAQRKGWTLSEAERWLAPNLGYDPDTGERRTPRAAEAHGAGAAAHGFAAARICARQARVVAVEMMAALELHHVELLRVELRAQASRFSSAP